MTSHHETGSTFGMNRSTRIPHCGLLALVVTTVVFLLVAVTVDSFRGLDPWALRRRSICHRHGSATRWGAPTLCDVGCRDHRTTCLWSTSARQPTASTATTVVYQKVVRVTGRGHGLLSHTDFLGHVVTCLTDFVLPERLPMVYQPSHGVASPFQDNDDTATTTARYVVQWDSPLSPHAPSTALNVQVVAIYTDSQKYESDTDARTESASHLAMVLVEKASTSSSTSTSSTTTPHGHDTLPPMLQGLFADSERKILKALDRALDEFMDATNQGHGLVPSHQAHPSGATQTDRQGHHALLAELVETTSTQYKAGMVASSIVDAEYDTDPVMVPAPATDPVMVPAPKPPTVVSKAQQAAWATMKVPVTETPAPQSSIGLEYAVQAAQRAHAQRRAKQSKNACVPEAPNVARPQFPLTVANDTMTVANAPTTAANAPAMTAANDTMPPRVDSAPSNGRTRAFRTTISKPSDYAPTAMSNSSAAPVSPRSSADGVAVEFAPTAATNATSLPNGTVRPGIHLTVRDTEREPTMGNWDDRIHRLGSTDQIVRGAQDALNEMVDLGKDVSPEELLAEVMKFGDQQEATNEGGDGFVSGAFEKAKDILRQQQEKRVERQRTDPTWLEPGPNPAVRDISPEEELRQMFEAGERIADGRMTTVTASMAAQVAADKEIDALIASDSTVSRYGRILDDELVELEVRINKSPGEDLDGPDKNPLFDIFSGPEVYDVNVDPATAVNWPGALPGTKTVRLPKELEEAVKQANFAVEVLRNLREVDSTDGATKFTVGTRELTVDQVANLRSVADEAIAIGLIADPILLEEERARLQMLLDELTQQPEERTREIASEYKDLLLSDNFVTLVKMRLTAMADRDLDALRHDNDSLEALHARERIVLGQLVAYAQLLLKEVQALGAELESQQLEVIRSICKVAMDPSHQTEEETATALKDAVRDMRPLFDDAFVAYLKYAVAEEEGRLARAGQLDDPDHNRWLFVLKIVQQGVYAEISKGINRYLEHIWYVLRMETPIERRMLLRKLVDVMPTLDVRPFVQVVENIVGALGDGARGEFDGVVPLGEMTNKLLQLHRDLTDILPPERIAEKSRDADEWAARQKERLLQQRNLTKQRLKAAQATEHMENEIEAFGRGETERFD